MKKLGATGLNFLWVMHILSMIFWMGGIASNFVLQLLVTSMGEQGVLGLYVSIHFIDLYMIRTGAQGLLLTGLIYGIFTNWGFLKHKWVGLKWFMFISQLIFGIAFLGETTERNYIMVKVSTAGVMDNPEFIAHQHTIVIGMGIQLVLLLIVIVISRYKPWGRRPLH